MVLQGFPHDYVLKGTMSEQFSMVSDAVSPPVADAVARAIGMQLNHRVHRPRYPQTGILKLAV